MQVAAKSSPSDLTGLSFENINLDTDVISASGEYSLADRTHEEILGYKQPDRKIDCPPRATPFDAYFERGRRQRGLLLRLAWDLTPGPSLNHALEEISRFFVHEQEVTLKDRVPTPDLGAVHFTKCLPDGTCIEQAKALVFLRNANVGVARGIVNYTAESGLLDIWLGALAASRLKGAAPGVSRDQVLHQVEQWRLEIVEEYRLEDTAADEGYYGWPDLCRHPPHIAAAVQ